ncbi:MAG: MurR/RpiR family transcriptional regulator [Deltaproteobacteria bacterium]|jgi:DNA-binding MurR/RpiR family transcriptional regulator|nr:MurR/RpiR family transcriptional regulator [Deltaproteobacteria bacterium]
METKESLLNRLARLRDLTASENKLALYLENNFPQVALVNLEEMSVRNDVSKATVTRFARRLGYSDFKDFSRALKEEVSQHFDLPYQRTSISLEQDASATPADLLRQHFELARLNMQRTLEQVDDAAFADVLNLLSDTRRDLYLMSFATGRTLLNYFYLLVKYHRGNVRVLDGPDRLAHDVIDAIPGSVLLATAFDRHPAATLSVLRHFYQLGCDTILLTNRRSSPLLKYARHTLFVHTEEGAIFKSRASMLVMLETLLSGMGARLQSGKGPRFKEMERLRAEFN